MKFLRRRSGRPLDTDRVWLLRFPDGSVNESASTKGETLADVRSRQDAGYWPEGRPGAWSTTEPDRWIWADDAKDPA